MSNRGSESWSDLPGVFQVLIKSGRAGPRSQHRLGSPHPPFSGRPLRIKAPPHPPWAAHCPSSGAQGEPWQMHGAPVGGGRRGRECSAEAGCKERAPRPRPAQLPPRRRARGASRVLSMPCTPTHLPSDHASSSLLGRSPMFSPNPTPGHPITPCIAHPRPAWPHTPFTWSLEAP